MMPDNIPEEKKDILHYACVAARLTIGASWKGELVPKIEDWQKKLLETRSQACLEARPSLAFPSLNAVVLNFESPYTFSQQLLSFLASRANGQG